jgi:hypothetical protein
MRWVYKKIHRGMAMSIKGFKTKKGKGAWGASKVKKSVLLTPELWAALEELRMSPYYRRGGDDAPPLSFSTFLEIYLRFDFDKLENVLPTGGFVYNEPMDEETAAIAKAFAEANERVRIEEEKYKEKFDKWLMEQEEYRDFVLNQEQELRERYFHTSYEGEVIEDEVDNSESEYVPHPIEYETNKEIIMQGHDWLHEKGIKIDVFIASHQAWGQVKEDKVIIESLCNKRMPSLHDIHDDAGFERLCKKLVALPIEVFAETAPQLQQLKAKESLLSDRQREWAAYFRLRGMIDAMEGVVNNPPAWIDGQVGLKSGEVGLAQLRFWGLAKLIHDGGLFMICKNSLIQGRAKKVKLRPNPNQELAAIGGGFARRR